MRKGISLTAMKCIPLVCYGLSHRLSLTSLFFQTRDADAPILFIYPDPIPVLIVLHVIVFYEGVFIINLTSTINQYKFCITLLIPYFVTLISFCFILILKLNRVFFSLEILPLLVEMDRNRN